MKCPTCAAWSNVLDTRDGPHETIRRRRECANGHRFFTFEMLAPARNPGSMQRAIQTVQARRSRWIRDQAIRRNADNLSRAELALHHGLGIKTVRDIQAQRRRR